MGSETLDSYTNTGIMLTTSGAYGAPFTVTASGTIKTGGEYGIDSNLAAPVLVNEGSIADTASGFAFGVYLTEGGTVQNSTGAVIQGGLDAVFIEGAAGNLSNAGTIRTTSHYGVQLQAGGTVSNTGTIAGGFGAVAIKGSGGDLVVAGNHAVFIGDVTAAGTGNTLEFSGTGGTVASIGGQFSGFQTVAFDQGAAWTISLDAAELTTLAISGFALGDAIDLTGFAASFASDIAGIGLVLTGASGSETLQISQYGDVAISSDGHGGTEIKGEVQTLGTLNTSGVTLSSNSVYRSPFGVRSAGTIDTGNAYGLDGLLASSELFNAGTIADTSQSGYGVHFAAGGYIDNFAGAVIEGGAGGVTIANGTGALTNAGAIIGNTFTGILLAGGGSVENGANAVIRGAVDGVVVDGAAGTISNEGAISGIMGDGVLLNAGGTVFNDGIITGATYAVKIGGAGDALVVASSGAVFGGTVAAAGSGNTLELNGVGDTLVHIGSTFSGFSTIVFGQGSHWAIQGNVAQLSALATIIGTPDQIDLSGFAATAASYTAGIGLVLSNATGSTTLHFDPAAAYVIRGDGNGGTDIVFPETIATTTSGLTVDRYTSAYVASGATLTGATIYGNMFVESGAVLSDAVAEPGAHVFVEAGGTATSTTLGDEVLFSSTSTVQNANGYVVNSSDEQIGGLVTATYVTYQLTGDVTMDVAAGGAAYNTVIDAGDTQNIDAGGTAVGVTLNNATATTVKSFTFEYDYRSYVNDTRAYGATQNVDGGTVTNVTVSDNSQQNVNGGTVSNELANGQETINGGIVSNVSITNVNASVNLNGGTLDGISLVGILNINGGLATTVTIEGTVYVNDYKNEVYGVPTQKGYTPTVNLNGGTLTNAHIDGRLNRNGGTLLDSELGNGSHLQYGVNVIYGENQTGGRFIAGYIPNFNHPVTVNLEQLGIGAGAIENFYGVALDTRIDGGTQNDWGGTASSTSINGGVQRIGELIPTLFVNEFGSTQYFFNGVSATAVDTTLNSGQQFVGRYIYVQVNAGYTTNSGESQTYTASVDGTALNTTINGGAQYIMTTGTAINTTIFGGHQEVKGGVALNTTINNGGLQVVSYGEVRRYIPSIYTTLVGGTAFNTVINKGGEQWVGFTRAELAVANTTINNGGTQDVGGLGVGGSADGIANDTTINSGGKQFLSGGGGTNPGGFASSTVIENGGAQYVGVPITVETLSTGGSNFELRTYGGAGFAVATTIFNAGEQFVQDDGTAVDTTIDIGGLAQVTSGGVIESAIINGGTLQLEQGAMLGAGGTVLEPYQQINPGFDRILSRSVASYGPGITFAAGNVGGVLELTAGVGIVLSAPIYGFNFGDTIDLAGFTATSDIFVAGSGLTLSNATAAQTLDLSGNFTGEQFALGTDASGTVITLELAPGAVGGGSSSTLAGGSLASIALVGGTLDVSGGGTLGALGINGSGAEVSLSTGAVLTLSTPLTLTPGATLDVAGGTLVVEGSISLSGAITESGASLYDDGTLENDGTITLDPSTLTVESSLTGTGVVTIGADSTLDVTGSLSAGQTIVFAGAGAELQLEVMSGDFTEGTVGSGMGTIDFTNLPISDILLNGYGPTCLSVGWSGNLDGQPAGGFVIVEGDFPSGPVDKQDDGHGGTEFFVSPLCYLQGTRILTPAGQVAVEDLRAGDAVVTRFGGIQRVKWLGRQSYAPAFIANHLEKWPVCIKAGALADGVPARDLYVSPGHSMLLENVLLLASQLVNGVTITQTRPSAQVNYVQIDLGGHDCVIAEGAWSETYADSPGQRAQFHNAAEFYALYPEEPPVDELRLCAKRPERGPALAAALTPVAARAASGIMPGPLEGWAETAGGWKITGWARDLAHPGLPVLLEILVGGQVIGTVLACDFRADLRQTGKGSGHCAFSFIPPFRLRAEALATLIVRRAADGAEIAWSGDLGERLLA